MLTSLAALTPKQISKAFANNGYFDMNVHSIVDIEKLKDGTAMYTVRFVDDGSFGDNEPFGKVFVWIDKDTLQVVAEV
jgi:hypothetical protein